VYTMKTKLLKHVLLLSVMLLTVFAAQLPALAATQAEIDEAIANAATNPEALAAIIADNPDMAKAIIAAAVTLHPDSAGAIVSAAVTTNPGLTGAIVGAAAASRPDLATIIADAAITANPGAETIIIASINDVVDGFAEGYTATEGGVEEDTGDTGDLEGGCAS
jgi:hypothetical protein